MARKTSKYSEWSPKAMAILHAVIGFLFGLLAIIWHGMLGQPSMMSFCPVSGFANSSSALWMLISITIAGYVMGYIVALIYNWALKK